MFGSARLPAREKVCSLLASWQMCAETCAKNGHGMRCGTRAKAIRASHLLKDNEVQRKEIFLVVEQGELIQHALIVDKRVDLVL